MKAQTIKKVIRGSLFPFLFLLISCAAGPTATTNVAQTRNYTSSAPAVEVYSAETVAAVLAVRGNDKLQSGDLNGAIRDFQRGFEISPAHMKAPYAELLGMTHGMRGIIRAANGEISAGIHDLEICTGMMQTGPERETFREALALLYTIRGAESEAEGDLLPALEFYLKAADTLSKKR